MIFLVSYINGDFWLANTARALVVPLFAVLYVVSSKDFSPYFITFLICYSISDLISIYGFNRILEWEYYIGNSLYIMAYLSFSMEILLSVSKSHILKYFKVHLIVLAIVNVYANYILINFQSEYVSSTDYIMELSYNIATTSLVSVSLLNYFYRDDKKALILFLGSLSIAVSEVIQIVYYYLLDANEAHILNVSYSLFLILGFYFYYAQSKLEYEDVLVIA